MKWNDCECFRIMGSIVNVGEYGGELGTSVKVPQIDNVLLKM